MGKDRIPIKPVACVTGAGSPIGRSICRALAREGFDLALHFNRSIQVIRRLVGEMERAGARAFSFRADLQDPGEAERLIPSVVRRTGRLDLLVNNASRFSPDPPGGDRDFLQGTFQINFFSPRILCRAAAPWLRKARGSIVQLTDLYAEFPILKGYGGYCASKAALVNLTKSLAVEWAPRVRVNAVSPGAITFPGSYSAGKKRALARRSLLKRTGTPEEVAEAVRFLAQNRFITGQVLKVDGGRFL